MGIWSGVISELGYVALVMALVLSALQCVLPCCNLLRVSSQHIKTSTFSVTGESAAPVLAIAQCLVLLVSFLCLMFSFYHNDFSLVYVANHSNTSMPWYYKLSATWGGHEGSLLFWVLILSLWCAGFAVSNRKNLLHHRRASLSQTMLVVMGLVQTCMLSLVIFSSSPFDKFFPLPVDGADLNPLLQDPGLIFHPPMLYMGYVGLVIPFAFAVAVLCKGELKRSDTVLIRTWVLAAWACLTLGIALGSWWAYYELGWGGWWFWDPVENASLMPWLTATALIHALAVTSKRGVFKAWTIMLCILAFGLSLLGTFLVRSGVLTSVHAFAADPERGFFVLMVLAVLVGGALLLFAMRGWRVSSSATATFELRSRESLLALNTMLLMTALLVVFLGTFYPIIADAFRLGQVSVGAPYFNALFVPVAWLVLLGMGMSPVLRWRQHTHPLRGATVVVSMTAIVMVIIIVSLVQHGQGGLSHLGQLVVTLFLSVWVLGWLFYDIWQKVTRQVTLLSYSYGVLQACYDNLTTIKLPYWAMQLAHLGVVVCCIGVAATSSLSVEKDSVLRVGETVQVAGYNVRFEGMKIQNVENYTTAIAEFDIKKNGARVTTLYPEKRRYMIRQQVMTEAGIDGTFWRDIYIALGEPLDAMQPGQANRRKNASRLEGERWAVRVYVKPMVRWIWLGAIMMALSAFILVLHGVINRKSVLAKTKRDLQEFGANDV